MFLADPADWSMRCLQSQLGPANTSTFQSSASGTRSRNSGCSMRVEAFAGINISGRLDHPLGMSADRNAVANDGSPAYGCDKTCVVYGTADTAAAQVRTLMPLPHNCNRDCNRRKPEQDRFFIFHRAIKQRVVRWVQKVRLVPSASAMAPDKNSL
jgi:hypothetical protein